MKEQVLNIYILVIIAKAKWWMCVNFKAHKSSVVTFEIDPTSFYVISGLTDLRIYVSYCYLPEIMINF